MEKIKQALGALRNDLHHVPMTDRLGSAFRHLDAALSELEGSKPKEPPRYVRSGPPVQMQDVLLACGELNERERVAVRWVLDKINELPESPRYVMSKDYEALYELLCKGGEALGTLNSIFNVGGFVIRRINEWTIMCYGVPTGGYALGLRQTGMLTERAAFKAECTRLNLEWIAVEPPKEQGAEPVPSAREKAMEEAECTFYRDGHRIVQRLLGRDEFGDPQVTERYMPVEAAIAMHEELGSALLSERSKPSLMVGFSEEDFSEIADRIADESVGELCADNTGEWIAAQNAVVDALCFANTRAVSIDRLVEAVKEWIKAGVDGSPIDDDEWKQDEWIKAEADLRERLMKIRP